MSRPRRLKVVVEADGGARGNPGPAGYGAVVCEAATGEVLVERSASIGVATNNVAEYQGLIAGLQAAADLGAVEVEVRMDSKLVVEQMSGRWQIKHPGLRPLAASAAQLAGRFDSVRYTWIPREQNRRADALANAAMDGRPPPEPELAAPPVQPPTGLPGAPPGPARSWAPPAAGTATRLILVRHGETELTAQRRYSGRGDIPLSPAGLDQARATATRLAGYPVAAVVSSPLVRCVATAKEIAGQLPVRVEPGLIECDFGEWEGLSFTEVKRRWPQELERWLASPSVAPPGGESFEAVLGRVRDVRDALVGEFRSATVVAVSHVTPIKLLLQEALAATDAFLHRLFLDPAGISIVDLYPDGNVAVRTVNDTSHL